MRIIYQNEGFFMLNKKICISMRLKEISIPKIWTQIYNGIGSKIQKEMCSFDFLHFWPQNW